MKRRVWVGLVFAGLIVPAWWVWTQNLSSPVPVVVRSAAPFVQLAEVGKGDSDQLLREQAEYFDPTPLFFPTSKNFGRTERNLDRQQQPDRVFGAVEPYLTFTEQVIRPYGSAVAVGPESLVEVVGPGNETPLSGMGQSDAVFAALPERSAFLEIRNLRDGKLILAQTLENLKVPRTDFAPLEFLAVISPEGLVGDPFLINSGSGWEEVDTFLRSHLAKIFRLGDRLAPGRYRVLIGP